jgi:hypothetical protein
VHFSAEADFQVIKLDTQDSKKHYKVKRRALLYASQCFENTIDQTSGEARAGRAGNQESAKEISLKEFR